MLFFEAKAKTAKIFVVDRFYMNIASFSQNFAKIDRWVVEFGGNCQKFYFTDK